jgi:hypothetical protein
LKLFSEDCLREACQTTDGGLHLTFGISGVV